MTPHRWMASIALISALLVNGCRHSCHKKPPCATCPNPMGPSGPSGPASTLPPQGIPLDPPPSTGMKPEVLLPEQSPPNKSNYVPPARSQVQLGDPDFNAPSAAVEERKPLPKVTAPPAPADDKPSVPLPVGISSFAQVKDNVSTGRRPDLGGLDWLHTNGHKTVLFLRSGKEDDSSDRKQVESRGMKYESLVITPETISPTTVMEFNRLINEADSKPIFVYDLDGKRAGAMWYLHFRSAESLKDDEARVRASRFGLKETGDAEQVQLWTAIQKYLAERNP